MPRPTKVNVAYNTAGELQVPPPIIPAKLYYDYAVGHQDAIEHENMAINARFGVANCFRGLVTAIGLLIVSASLSVALGSEQAPNPTHVIVDRSQ
jgi:hypothetical protein